ncbi:E3 ubiquitin/ISG15 ligase TRIM25-like [Betta splendens]|uniref:E3 ubiquitin/ISG15 ligase TRIM25-like n=1 Tax=Betta splendens TaxID=158456 RepID=A0A6P7MPX7_BETSP|nr:E3 ubiquitin/ISG15 ligase TRIM25-like [Betta splendens]
MADNPELFDCSICLQLLEDPVTTLCGHNYCMKCINTFWDQTDSGDRAFSCPQCRETFFPRPVLKRNTLLADLLEQHKKKNCQNAEDEDAAAPGDVQCDGCTGNKRKASMFCLVCLASYCETHLQPHFEVSPLKKHRLVPACAKIKESICQEHNKLLELYCRTDQQFICLMCGMEKHQGHDTVEVAAEMAEMQRRLDGAKLEILGRMQDSQRKMAQLKEAAASIRAAAWEACDDFEQLCEAHIRGYVRSVQRKFSEVREKVGDVEKAGVDWTDDCVRQLQREASALRSREDDLDQLSLIDDPVQFLKGLQDLGPLPVSPDAHDRLNTLTDFVTAQKDKLRLMCNKEKQELSSHSENTQLLKIPKQQQILSRTSFKANKAEVEVDPCTVAACLCLANSNRQMLWSERDQGHPDHPDRFTHSYQALCKEGLDGNHYWEVQWDGGVVELAVSYKSIKRKGYGKDCCFGHNDVSWKLTCSPSGCTFWHHNLHRDQIPPAFSRRVRIHLDCEAGGLSFYHVCGPDNMILLHRIQTTFTEPLYPGFSVDLGATLEICNI